MQYERTAREDIRWWMLFLVGAVFLYGGSIVDPATNCDPSGRECAPWLVPIAKWLGAVFGLIGLGHLIANPSRGSQIDLETGDLVWWQNRFGRKGGKEGRIHPSQISRIRIVPQSDNMDEVHLYDLDGVRQAYFDGEVIPSPFEAWAKKLAAKWPHIRVETQ